MRRGVPVLVALALSAGPALAEVTVEARLSRSAISVGEATTLEVTVNGATLGINQPTFEVPPGLQVLGRGSSRNFSWVNGRANTETVYRFEISSFDAGRFTVGPIDVRVGGTTYRSPPVTLTVAAEERRIGQSGGGAAVLRVDLSPSRPYVGQPVLMRVRLVLRQRLAEDPSYTPPPTPGFWSEGASPPESYYADEAMARVLVTETRTRLYPLAEGETTVGEAAAALAFAVPGAGLDPLQWLRGNLPRRQVLVKSRPVTVNVRPLPAGAPPGFDGAVGDLSVRWSADRAHTSRDVPVTVRLDVRGTGNLPLLRTPDLQSDDFEVFSSTTSDSLGTAGTLEPGRRAFQWTVLPRRVGRLTVRAPRFVWFDPSDGAYHTATSAQVAIDVGPPLNPDAPDRAGFPAVFQRGVVDPFGRAAAPWGWAVAGLLLGITVQLWRRGRGGPDAGAHEAGVLRDELRKADGAPFWTAAERAASWLEARGASVDDLRRTIESARYAGAVVAVSPVRGALDLRLATAARPVPRPWWRRAAPAAVGVLALGLLYWCAPHAGGVSGPARVRAGDHAARNDDLDRAERVWRGLWREGGRHPALAARLAWADAQRGDVAGAAAWVLRGERLEARDPALRRVVEQVREAGGLVGYAPSRMPVRRLEWSIAALVLALGATLLWPRRRRAVMALLVAAVACAAAPSVDDLREGARPRGVVRTQVTLEGANLELEPGQVVRLLGAGGGRVRVRAGRGVTGWLPAGAVTEIEARS